MKSSQLVPFVTLVTVCAQALGYNPFRHANEVPLVKDGREHSKVAPEYNPTAVLDSSSRDSDVYSKAMQELKRLEDEKVCHGLAGQLLWNSCRGLDGVNEADRKRQEQLHIDTFANSFAICDLERFKLNIPRSCSPFTVALQQAARDGNSKWRVTPDQVSDCLEAIGLDPTSVSFWISHRDKALSFCKAASLEIDKDRSILLHKKLTETMETFTTDLEEDLKIMRKKMVNNQQVVDSHFEKMSSHVENLASEFKGNFEAFSVDLETVKSTVKAIVGTSGDGLDRLEKFITAFLKGHTDMADQQEKALAVATNTVQNQMADLAELVGEAYQGTMELKAALQVLVPMVVDISSRQTALENQSAAIFANMANATDLLQGHLQKLAQADLQVIGIHENLGRTSETVKSWSERFSVGRIIDLDWAWGIGGALVTFVAGNYGITPSTTKNLGLLASGFIGTEILIQIPRLEILSWCSMWWSGSSFEESQHPHMPRERAQSSLAATPVEFEVTSTFTGRPRSVYTTHADMAYGIV